MTLMSDRSGIEPRSQDTTSPVTQRHGLLIDFSVVVLAKPQDYKAVFSKLVMA